MQSRTLLASKFPQGRRSSCFIIKYECVLSIPSTSAPHFPAIQTMRMRPLSFKAFLPSERKPNIHLMIERRIEKIQPRIQVGVSWFVFGLSKLTFWPSPLILLLFLPLLISLKNSGFLNTDSSASPSLQKMPIFLN